MQSKTLCLMLAAAALAVTAGCKPHSDDTTAAPATSAEPATTGGDQSAAPAAAPAAGADAGTAPSSSGSTMEAIDDTALTAKVKAALLAESSIKAGDITVTTNQGTVTLTGTTDSQASSDKAAQIVKDTGGVKGVDNQLTIKQ